MSDTKNFELEPLADTGFTCGWVLAVLTKRDEEFGKVLGDKKVVKLSAHDISDGKGVCSKVFKTQVFVENSDNPIYNFIIKVPTTDTFDKNNEKLNIDSNQVDAAKALAEAHNIECDFYDVFGKQTALPLPRVFYTQKFLFDEKQAGAIFMEDLSKKMVSCDVFMSLNEFQMKNITRHMAEFHAYQLKNQDLWKNKFDPKVILFGDEMFINMNKMTNEKAMEIYPEPFKSFNKIQKATHDAKNVEYTLRGCCKDLELPELVQMGDLWTNNVIWHKSDTNIPSNVLAFIDFTLAFEGNPAFDFGRLMCFCLDAEVRRDMETWIFDYYYENLAKFLGKKPDFDVESFKKAYDYGLINQSCWLPMLAVVIPRQKVSEEVWTAKMEKYILRAKLCLEDVVEKLEKLKVGWVNTGA